MGVNSLPKTVTRQCRGCDLNPGPPAPESSTLREIGCRATHLPENEFQFRARYRSVVLRVTRRTPHRRWILYGVIVARLPIVRSLACLCISDGTASTIQPHHIRFPTALR